MLDINRNAVIIENHRVSSRTWHLVCRLEVNAKHDPEFANMSAGQFVNISIPGKYLRRPISVNRLFSKENELHLLYNIAGEGTKILSEMKPGDEINLLIGLGNGFQVPQNIKHPLLLGGGIGAAPLMELSYQLVANGIIPQVVLGYNTAEESWGMEKELREMGIATYVATVDGTLGTKGFVTDAIKQNNISYDYFFACGPMPMLKAVSALPTDGQLSLECRMGCGFGACMCCSLETKNGNKRICLDGPVFGKNDLIWK